MRIGTNLRPPFRDGPSAKLRAARAASQPTDAFATPAPSEHQVASHLAGNRARKRKILRFGVGWGRKRRATPAAPPLLTRIDPAKPQVADLNPKQRHHRTPPNLPRTVIFCTLERLFRQDGLEGALRAARKRLRKLRGPPRATEEASSQHARTPPDVLDEKSGRSSQESSIFSQTRAL